MYMTTLPEKLQPYATDVIYVPELMISPADLRIWEGILAELQGCLDYPDFIERMRKLGGGLPPLDLPGDYRYQRLSTDPQCEITQQIIPRQSIDIANPYAIRSPPDGSCFCHAASRLAFGHSKRHDEMRVRICFEMHHLFEDLLNHDYLERGLDEKQKGQKKNLVKELLW